MEDNRRPRLLMNEQWSLIDHVILICFCLVSEKELQKLYKNFTKIDRDNSGTLEPEEFFDIPGRFLP